MNIKSWIFYKIHHILLGKLSSVLILQMLCVLNSCCDYENRKIIKEEGIEEFGMFLNFINTESYQTYNLLSDNTRFYMNDTIGFFLTFDDDCINCPSEYLIVLKEGKIAINRSHRSRPESYCSSMKVYIEYLLSKRTQTSITEVSLIDLNTLISTTCFKSDSLHYYASLWNGVKKDGSWDTRGYYFYAEWDLNNSMVRHYHFEKVIEFNTERIFTKLRNF